MKLLAFFLVFIGFSNIISGQSLVRSEFGAGELKSDWSNGHVRSTFGQVATMAFYRTSGQLRQGFEQPIETEIVQYGCQDSDACNYNPHALDDDGSCEYLSCLIGCTDSTACNYDASSIADDGSCDFSCCPGPGCCSEGTYWSGEVGMCIYDDCFADMNGDGYRGTTDLLLLLSVYGTNCPE